MTKIALANKKIASLEEEIRLLRLQVQALKLAQSRAVKTDDHNQAHLNFQYTETLTVDNQQDDADDATGQPAPEPKNKRRKKTIRGLERFDHLPVAETTLHMPHEVKDHPEQWEEVSRTENFEIEVKPATLHKHVHIYPKYRHRIDKDMPLIRAKAPPRFSASFVSASLATDIVLSKYGEHSTLYRTESRLREMGAAISRQTMSDAVERFAQWFKPVYDKMTKSIVEYKYVQIDETFIRYIFGQAKGKGTGYYWGIHRPGGETVLIWIPNRQHKNVDTLLAGFSGLLQSDGYAAYENYARKHQGVVLLACWAHALRKFRDAEGEEPVHSQWLQQHIGQLYVWERRWEQFTQLKDSTRQRLREKYSLPQAHRIKQKLDELSVDFSVRGEKFNLAVKYALNRWSALLECLKHGHTRLDTNELENRFRPSAIGKKNWLFVGHPEAGEKGAIIYTLMANCRNCNIRPLDYFQDALPKLVAADAFPPTQLVESLIPQNWAKAHPDKIIKEPIAQRK
jgi:transposase